MKFLITTWFILTCLAVYDFSKGSPAMVSVTPAVTLVSHK